MTSQAQHNSSNDWAAEAFLLCQAGLGRPQQCLCDGDLSAANICMRVQGAQGLMMGLGHEGQPLSCGVHQDSMYVRCWKFAGMELLFEEGSLPAHAAIAGATKGVLSGPAVLCNCTATSMSWSCHLNMRQPICMQCLDRAVCVLAAHSSPPPAGPTWAPLASVAPWPCSPCTRCLEARRAEWLLRRSRSQSPTSCCLMSQGGAYVAQCIPRRPMAACRGLQRATV